MNDRQPALVLIHGGAHAADCWDLTIGEIRCRDPQLQVFAVDLPGRGSRPGPISTMRLHDFVSSVVRDINSAGLDRVVIAAHSLGGMTAPGVAAQLGSSRVAELIFIAAIVPPHGSCLLDVLGGALSVLARIASSLARSFPLPPLLARFLFWNGISPQRRQFARRRLCLESPAVLADVMDLSTFPRSIPRTWVITLRDRALSVRRQHQGITALGGAETILMVDSCHDVMISEPGLLAELLIDRCRGQGT